MRNTKKNIVTTLISQLVITICGMVIPRVMIGTFGSAMYGLTTSITQFLSYISLMESGIGLVARAELYEPLAKKDNMEVSKVYHAIKHFFMLVAFVFLGYTLVLSIFFYDIAQVQESGRLYVCSLVWVMSAVTLAKYLGGLTNITLICADQKQYVVNFIVTSSTIINAVMVVVLSRMSDSILVVKIGSSLVYVAQPVCYWLYVKKYYKLPKVGKERSKLKQKWTGIGQHIAYFLHTNIDVVILTLFANLQLVAVYSVYKLVISSIRKIAGSFTSGMEAGFGEMIAKKEQSLLQSAFRRYKHMLSFMSVILFGTTAVLVVPFVKLYTAGITDADYIQPAFAVALLLAEAVECFMQPCTSLPISANKLKETRWGAYGEAIVNIVLSLILVQWNPLIGVALATLIATVLKSGYYMVYAAKKILHIRIQELGKNFLLTAGCITAYAILGNMWLQEDWIGNYIEWILWGCGIFAAISLVTSLVYFVFYPDEQKYAIKSVLGKFRKR